MNKLLIFSFSPVQGFISTSRRPRDLFTGSYMISYLTQELIKRLDNKVKVIFPVIESSREREELANCGNKFVALVEEELCQEARKKFTEIWTEICSKVWKCLKLDVNREVEEQFWRQVNGYFNVFCTCLDFVDIDKWKEILELTKEEVEGINGDNYAFTYDLSERVMGAKKSWRSYIPVVDSLRYKGKKGEETYPNGCTMCGERLHLAFDWRERKNVFREEKVSQHIRDGERLCGVCLVKRFAVKFYFEDKFNKEKNNKDLDLWHYPSTEEIAGIKFKEKLKEKLEEEPNEEIKAGLQNLAKLLEDTPYIIKKPIVELKNAPNLDSELFRREGWDGLFRDMEDILGKEKTNEVKKELQVLLPKLKEKYSLEHKNPYFAILISDGDSIGEWLGIKSTIRQKPLSKSFHYEFSRMLSEYAGEVANLKDFPRQMIYAGGDDVMALLHPFDAVCYAHKCAQIFRSKFKELAFEGKEPSVSAGILITHAKMSLQKALEETRELEKKAKSVEGKGAFCVGIMTRTGNLTYFVSKWDKVKLYYKLVRAFREKEGLSSSVAYVLRLLKAKFYESVEDEILLSVIKRTLRRKYQDNDWEELYKDIEDFYMVSKDYKEDELFPFENLVNLFYVARFVGTLREVW